LPPKRGKSIFWNFEGCSGARRPSEWPEESADEPIMSCMDAMSVCILAMSVVKVLSSFITSSMEA
jgi:hypothetical protein